MVYEQHINPDVVQGVYNDLVDSLAPSGASTAELITAMLVLLGTQYNGGAMSARTTSLFVKEANNFLVRFFKS